MNYTTKHIVKWYNPICIINYLLGAWSQRIIDDTNRTITLYYNM
jgi:hypothetical protein